MEDILKSFPAVKVAADMIHKIKLLYDKGGFNLTKFSSNHVGVLRSIPNEHRKDGVSDRDFNLGILPKDKALRVKWNIQEDTLGFIVMMNDKPPTKCGLLAALSSVYDPLVLGHHSY